MIDPDRLKERLDHWIEIVRKSGIKLTHQRIELFRELASREDHPDAESLYQAVHVRMPTVSRDTVYRTLWMLRDLGLIETLSPRQDGIRFDARLDRHHHFVCVRCGLVRDFESEELNTLRIPESVAGLGGILEARVEVRGICTACEATPKIINQPEQRHEHEGDPNHGR